MSLRQLKNKPNLKRKPPKENSKERLTTKVDLNSEENGTKSISELLLLKKSSLGQPTIQKHIKKEEVIIIEDDSEIKPQHSKTSSDEELLTQNRVLSNESISVDEASATLNTTSTISNAKNSSYESSNELPICSHEETLSFNETLSVMSSSSEPKIISITSTKIENNKYIKKKSNSPIKWKKRYIDMNKISEETKGKSIFEVVKIKDLTLKKLKIQKNAKKGDEIITIEDENETMLQQSERCSDTNPIPLVPVISNSFPLDVETVTSKNTAAISSCKNESIESSECSHKGNLSFNNVSTEIANSSAPRIIPLTPSKTENSKAPRKKAKPRIKVEKQKSNVNEISKEKAEKSIFEILKSKQATEGNDKKEKEIAVEYLEEINTEDSEREPVPQIRVLSNGSVSVDENSLTVKTTSTCCDCKTKSNDGSKPSNGWNHKETLSFYEALSKVGPDFEAMTSFFPNRTRKNLLRKFKTEERIHGNLISKILITNSEYDLKTALDELREYKTTKVI